jgi:hypothetical protein
VTRKIEIVRLALAGFALLASLGGCALTPPVTLVKDPHRLASIAEAPTAVEKDRRAILAMLGEYQVDFGFEETVVLGPGYERREPKHTGAHEAVVLVEDSGRKIVLQHLLVSDKGGHVIKHWRQDWTYEAAVRFEFTEDQLWRTTRVAPETTKEAWTQCVYEVSDAPRYCGTGKWNHRYGVATWTSDRTWRPLPRREYTTRSDYNAINAENRHTIVPGGWTHEQDNTKVQRDGERTTGTLVREFGFNDYRRVTGFDFTPAYRYWGATKDYWARVRAQWEAQLAAAGGLRLKTKVDGMPVIEALFSQAGTVQKGGTVSNEELEAVFVQWVETSVKAVSDASGAGLDPQQ